MRDLVDLTVELSGMALAKKKTSVDTVVTMRAVISVERASDLGIPWQPQESVDGRINPKAGELKFEPPDLGTTVRLWDDDTKEELLETGFSLSSMTAKADGDFSLDVTFKGRIAPAKRGTWSALMDKAAVGMDLLWATAPVRLDEIDHLLEMMRNADGTWDVPLMSLVVDRIGRDLFADEFFGRAPDATPDGITLETETAEGSEEHEIVVTVAGRNDDQPIRALASEWRAALNEIRARVEHTPEIPEGTPPRPAAEGGSDKSETDGDGDEDGDEAGVAEDAAAALGEDDEEQTTDVEVEEAPALEEAAQAAEDAAAALGEETDDASGADDDGRVVSMQGRRRRAQ